MPWYNADLHIHTCLSPCGSLEMSPRRIIARACERGMQVIAITDHNSTRNVQVCMECGAAADIMVIPGCEVNTQEEVHCLCYFPHLEALHLFQEYLDRQIIDIPHDPERFGYQVAVDADEQILFEESRSLFTGISDGIEALEKVVHRYGGLFVPAHIDRQVYGILSQLGFIPQELSCDALELSRQTTPDAFVSSHPELEEEVFYRIPMLTVSRISDLCTPVFRWRMPGGITSGKPFWNNVLRRRMYHLLIENVDGDTGNAYD